MDYQSVIAAHIESQVKRHKFGAEQASFYNLSQKEKREIAAYALVEPDGDDMLVNYEVIPLTQLIFSCVVKNTINANQLLEVFLDDLVKRYHSNFSEKFDQEVENYQLRQRDEIDNYHDEDAPINISQLFERVSQSTSLNQRG